MEFGLFLKMTVAKDIFKMPGLSLKEKLIIEEETENLRKLQSAHLPFDTGNNNHSETYWREILSLNQIASQSSADDRAQLNTQINRLETLSQVQYHSENNDINFQNPYFAHIKLREKEKTRNLYIGNQVLSIPEASMQIIDWKTSPISIIYFLYEEGEQYEEEIESRWFEGVVELKRQLKISNGEIVGIRQKDLILAKDKDGWIHIKSSPPLLQGGSGYASRPENIFKNTSGPEEQRTQISLTNTALPEITALLDPEQYKLITSAPDTIVAVKGVAGSGKTTVALHRAAWLRFRHSQRFPEHNIIVMTFNKSLANYISKALRSLELKKIQAVCLDDWFSEQRKRLFGGHFHQTYSSQTPMSAIIFKKHPVLLKIIDQFIHEKETSFDRELDEILNYHKKLDFPFRRLKSQPLISSLFALYRMITAPLKPASQEASLNIELKSSLQRLINNYIDPEKSKIETLLKYWDELFSNFQYLKEKFRVLADNISQSALEEAINWLKRQYIQKHNSFSPQQADLFETVSSSSQKRKKKTQKFVLDYEDNPILLYFYQKLLKPIPYKNKSLKYSHLMIDEAQDLSLIELATLLSVSQKPYSLTLAGDVHQKSVENSYNDWGRIFEDLNVKEQNITTLKVGYRSTFQIMEFAFSVLGSSVEQEFTATRQGPPVKLLQFENQGELIYFLSKNLKNLTTKENQASIALICLTSSEAKENYELLKKLETPRLRLVDDQNFSFTPGIDITDVQQVKGLEFDYVILLNVDNVNYPTNKYSKYLLHIASTRAAHQLWLMNHRQPSPLLPQSLVNTQCSNL